MASSLKAIIFDFDGTLYDYSIIPLRLILHEPQHLFRIRADRVVRKKMKGMDFDSTEAFEKEYNRLMSKHTHLSPEENFKWYQDTYVKKTMTRVLERHYKIRDGLKDFILRLKERGIKMAVLSDYPLVTERLLAVGMDQETIACFSDISSTQELGCLKPAKRAFLQIADVLGLPAENCLVVGDRLDTDGKGAVNSGMKFIQVSDKRKKKGSSAMSWSAFTQWAEKEFEL